jgi:nucleotide-binding universal stress UspA family protein
MARLEDAKARLAHRMGAHDPGGTHPTTEVIFGRAVQTIADYAANGDYDLIVMGTHGRSGMAHLLMGSVAESVVRTAPCPVMTVRDVAEPITVPAVDPGAIVATT